MDRHVSCLFLIVLVAAVMTCCCGCLFQDAVYPTITPDTTARGSSEEVFTFQFVDRYVTLTVPLDNSVLKGARNANKNASIPGDLEESDWLPPYYQSFITDSDLQTLYDSLGLQFSDVKDKTGLDDDEYLELITVFVQSIPYQTHDKDINPKFPIETLADQSGDCDDKSLLLAGLLAHEGYDVALLYFGTESHMAAGVRSDDCDYRGTGYAYIETTDLSWIGIAPEELESGVALSSAPMTIRIGTGTKGYGACGQTKAINQAFLEAMAVIEPILPEIEAMSADLATQEDEIADLKQEMDALRAAGKTGQYNSLVPVYNKKVETYNSDLAVFRELSEQFDEEVEVYNYILTHRFDRPGTYAWLARLGKVD